MSLKYLAKNILYAFFPRFGYWKNLKLLQKRGYRYDRDKAQILFKHNSKGPWRPSIDGVSKRVYDSYQEYLDHQAEKHNVILRSQGGFSGRTILSYRMKFYRRFKSLPRFLFYNEPILCLGARQGTEVEVLRDLGFSRAIGIDLNPGPSNPYVLPGDFMHTGFREESFGFLYSNSIDHAFDIDQFFREAARILKRDGLPIWDIAIHKKVDSQNVGCLAFESVQWEREECIVLPMLRYFKQIVEVKSEVDWKWFLIQGTNKV